MAHTHKITGSTPVTAISEFCCSQNENFCCYVALLELIFQSKNSNIAIIAQSDRVADYESAGPPVRLRVVALKHD